MKLLIIPGLGDSDEKHWQSYWLRKFDDSVKLIQDSWDEPTPEQWIERLNDTILHLDCPVIIVAHSLGVALVAHWANRYQNANIRGALLVAPADVDSVQHTPEVIRNFAPMPTAKLSFPSIVIASENDAYVDIRRAQYFAAQWGGDFVSIGAKGHINSDSDLQYWEEGQQLLQQLKEVINSGQMFSGV